MDGSVNFREVGMNGTIQPNSEPNMNRRDPFMACTTSISEAEIRALKCDERSISEPIKLKRKVGIRLWFVRVS